MPYTPAPPSLTGTAIPNGIPSRALSGGQRRAVDADDVQHLEEHGRTSKNIEEHRGPGPAPGPAPGPEPGPAMMMAAGTGLQAVVPVGELRLETREAGTEQLGLDLLKAVEESVL